MFKRSGNKKPDDPTTPAAPPPETPPPMSADQAAYDRHKAAAADRQRRIAEAGKEIGDLPPVVNPEQKEACRNNLQLFLENYLKVLYPLRWSAFHLAAIKVLQDLILDGGLFANAMPRGSGKSALIIGAIIWAGVYGHAKYAAIVCATDPKATDFVEDIKKQLEVNKFLHDDFPEVCYPICCLERITQRARGQTCNGIHTSIKWLDDTIVFPTVEGYASSGFRITTAGITGNIRGLRFTREDGSLCRPDFIIIDDPQTDESAKSEVQTKDRIDITQGAILGLFGPGEKKSVAMAITVIRRGDYADYYLAQVDWQGQRCGLLNRLPSGEQMDWWLKYRDIQKESVAQKRGKEPEKEFYLANRQTMTDLLEAMWPDRFNIGDEIDAIQNAMNEYFIAGSKKFRAEYMNDPEALSEGDLYKLDPAHVRNRLTGISRYKIPNGFDFLTVGADVQLRLIWYVVTAWRMDLTGTVVDYGWFPSQRNREFNLDELSKTLQSESGATDADVDAAVSWGLMEMGKTVFERRWEREDGSEIYIPAAQIDMNWRESETAVTRFCNTSKWRAVLTPAVGMAMLRNRRRISEWKPGTGETFPKPEERRQCEWMVTSRKQHGGRECHFDPNHWKSHVNMALSLPQHAPGSISFYGENPDEHEMMSQHVTSHYPIQVTYGPSSQQQWMLRPGVTRDDLLDCLGGCCVAASRHGARLTREMTVLPVVKPTQKRRRTKQAEYL